MRSSVAAFFRPVLAPFLWSRLGLWVLAVFSLVLFTGNLTPGPVREVGWAWDVWARWDSGWYEHIAAVGYEFPEKSTAFFPLYPGLMKLLGFAVGGPIAAGVLISLAASLVAFALLHLLARDLLGEDDARRAVVYLAVFPMTLFLSAVYSEALYLALTLAAFVLARRRSWLLAGVATGLAMLTRPTGAALLIALFVLAWTMGEARLRAAASLLAAVPLVLLWPAWLWWTLGDPLLFMEAQTDGWSRHRRPLGPFGGFAEGADAAWQGVKQLFAGPDGPIYWPNVTDVGPLQAATLNIEYFVFAVLYLVIGAVAWRKLGAAYGVLVLASLVLPLSHPTPEWPLLSMPRFGLSLFPVFLVLAIAGRRPRVDHGIVLASVALLSLFTVRWAIGEWVS